MTIDPMLAGAALGAAGGALAAVRNLPQAAATAVKRQLMVSADVPGGTSLFYMLSRWLDAQPYARTSRLVSAELAHSRDDDAEPRILFTPAVGEHILRFDGKLIWLTREQRDGNYGPIETYRLRALGRDQAIFRRMFLDVEAYCRAVDRSHLCIFMPNEGSSWREIARKAPRPVESVILDGTLRDDVLADIGRFIADYERYHKVGAPYRRGYLFYGPSGSGKTSLIEAIAGATCRDLYALNLARAGLDDVRLNELLLKVPARGAILIEDCDAVFAQRERTGAGSTALAPLVTFSGLLNALDGVGTKDGQLVFMTTNHVDRLDEALIRPGRVDLRAYIGNATRSQAAQMFARFFPGTLRAGDFADTVPPDSVKMAAIQNHLLAHPDEAGAIRHAPWVELRVA